MKRKRKLAISLACALLVGMMPMSNQTTTKAVSAAEITASGSHGLNNPVTGSEEVTEWDCVWFGHYWQEDTNGDGKVDKNDAKQPIKWRVLSVNGDDAFLLADKVIDVQRYHDEGRNVTWETCTMRSWLNGYGAEENVEGKIYNGSGFINYAFTVEEKSAIKTTNVVNNEVDGYGVEGGKDTLDQVYLLSVSEARNPAYGFVSKSGATSTRTAEATSYAARGGEIKSNMGLGLDGTSSWWRRSPGSSSRDASSVDSNGIVYTIGSGVSNSDVGVRPALHLNLSSTSSWSYAGKVDWKGKEISTAVSTPSAKPSTVAPSKPSINDFVVSIPSVSSKTASFLAVDQTRKANGYEVEVYKVKGGKKVKTLSASNGVYTSSMSFSKNTPYKYRVRYYVANNGRNTYGKR